MNQVSANLVIERCARCAKLKQRIQRRSRRILTRNPRPWPSRIFGRRGPAMGREFFEPMLMPAADSGGNPIASSDGNPADTCACCGSGGGDIPKCNYCIDATLPEYLQVTLAVTLCERCAGAITTGDCTPNVGAFSPPVIYPYLTTDISGDYYLRRSPSSGLFGAEDEGLVAGFDGGVSPCSWQACIQKAGKFKLAYFTLLEEGGSPENCCDDVSSPEIDCDLYLDLSIFPVSHGGKTYIRYELYASIGRGCFEGIVAVLAKDVLVSDAAWDRDVSITCFSGSISGFSFAGPTGAMCGPSNEPGCAASLIEYLADWVTPDGGDEFIYSAWVADPTATTASISAATSEDAGDVHVGCTADCPSDCTGCCPEIAVTCLRDCNSRRPAHLFRRGDGVTDPGSSCGFVSIGDTEGNPPTTSDFVSCSNGVWTVGYAIPCNEDSSDCMMVFTADDVGNGCFPREGDWAIDLASSSCPGLDSEVSISVACADEDI